MVSGKTGRKDCKDKEESGWRITVFHKRSSLKELKHLSCKETKDRSSITPVWALISPDLMSSTVSDKRSAKGSDVGRALLIQRVVIFLLQQHWVNASAKYSEHCAFSWGVGGAHRGCHDPWSSDCFQQLRALFQDPVQTMMYRTTSCLTSCPINLKEEEPSFSRWKTLQGAEQHLHSARLINSLDKLLLGWETGILSTISTVCSQSFLTFKNRTHTYIAIGW